MEDQMLVSMDEARASWFASQLPEHIRRILAPYHVYVCGGALRSLVTGESVNDIDIFGHEDALWLAACKYADHIGASVKVTPNSYSVTKPGHIAVQFVHRWAYTTPEEAVRKFDFTCCQAAIWFEDGKYQGVMDLDFETDALNKRIVYTQPDRPEHPAGSLMRLRKYMARGYTVSTEDFAKLVGRATYAYTDSDFAPTEVEWSTQLTKNFRDASSTRGY